MRHSVARSSNGEFARFVLHCRKLQISIERLGIFIVQSLLMQGRCSRFVEVAWNIVHAVFFFQSFVAVGR